MVWLLRTLASCQPQRGSGNGDQDVRFHPFRVVITLIHRFRNGELFALLDAVESVIAVHMHLAHSRGFWAGRNEA
jgi:hypothetical protein